MKSFTAEELNDRSKEELIELLLKTQEQHSQFIEQLALAKANRFGRSSEKLEIEGQVCFFNETESMFNATWEEPEFEEVVVRHKRKKEVGKREDDLKDFPVNVVSHELPEEKLNELFGKDNWKRLPDVVYKRLDFRPASYEVQEHHVAVYASKDNQTIVKADRPADLLRNSIVTPSLAAAIMNAKYVNAMPLYRLEQEFQRNDVCISRQTMANWMIRLTERYLSLVYDRMKEYLCSTPVIQVDETPVEVTKDGRAAGTQSYMWVYRTGQFHADTPIILYEYQKTRNASHPERFLKDFSGTAVCDGYQVYHKMENERTNIRIAGCWAHSRRLFYNVVKTAKGPEKERMKKTVAYKALRQISAIYHLEGTLEKLSPEERKIRRQLVVKPLVGAFFSWLKEHKDDVLPEGETGKGITYCLNQEKYLRVFLDDGRIPIDNNASERAIRSFVIGKNNWKLIDTIHGAQSSAILYSLVETAKANNLKIYDYLTYLLTEIPKHMDGTSLEFLNDLLPWSEKLPDSCRKKSNKSKGKAT